MFGYVSANKNELNSEDQKIYQAYYCGICQELKVQAGRKGQLLLNYDATFLAILLSGLYEPEETSTDFTCRLHPTKKKTYVRSGVMQYAASMNIVLSYYNLLDDYQDEGKSGKKRLADYLKPIVDRIRENYPRQVSAIEKYIKDLDEAEHRQEENLSIVSALTGEMLGQLCCYKDQDVWNDSLYNLGFYLGKFIYIMDAFEDLEEDEKKHNYNPLLFQKEKCSCHETLCKQLLTTQIAECTREFERMPILKNAEIIRNILYSGVWTKYDYIQLKAEKKEEKTDKKSETEAKDTKDAQGAHSVGK